MDLAPALPPSQDPAPVFVSSAAVLPQSASSQEVSPQDIVSETESISSQPPQLSLSPPAAPVGQPLHPALTLLPTRLTQSLAGVEPDEASTTSLVSAGFSSTGFISVSSLSNSFNFVGKAFRSARFGSVMGQPLYSASLPLSRVSQDSWKGSVLAADIQVKRVSVTPQVVQLENNVWAASFVDQCMPGESRQLQAGDRYRVSLGARTLGYVADENRAYLLAQQFKRLIRQASFAPDAIAPYPMKDDAHNTDALAIVGTPDQPFFAVNSDMAEAVGYSPGWAAVSWANNLRLALDAEPLKPGEALMGRKGLEESKIDMAGEASWYGPYFHGRATANGEIYDQYDLTVAHQSLPFGTELKVRNTVNDRTVVVRVNDRGPYVGDRILDLSRAAADCLGSDESGVVPVEATILKRAK